MCYTQHCAAISSIFTGSRIGADKVSSNSMILVFKRKVSVLLLIGRHVLTCICHVWAFKRFSPLQDEICWRQMSSASSLVPEILSDEEKKKIEMLKNYVISRDANIADNLAKFDARQVP